jgi:hypothetical protein
MIGWLYRMIVGYFHQCRHKWVEKSRASYKKEGTDLFDGSWTKTGQMIEFRCEHCGEFRVRFFGL